MRSRTLRALRSLRTEVGCARSAPLPAGKVNALRNALRKLGTSRSTTTAPRQASKATWALRAAVLRRAVSLAKPRRRPNCRCAGQHRRKTRTQKPTPASLVTYPGSTAQMLKRKHGMSAQSAVQPLPNPTLNRSANGRAPWPRSSCGSSSASRPRRPPVVARLAPR